MICICHTETHAFLTQKIIGIYMIYYRKLDKKAHRFKFIKQADFTNSVLPSTHLFRFFMKKTRRGITYFKFCIDYSEGII